MSSTIGVQGTPGVPGLEDPENKNAGGKLETRVRIKDVHPKQWVDVLRVLRVIYPALPYRDLREIVVSHRELGPFAEEDAFAVAAALRNAGAQAVIE